LEYFHLSTSLPYVVKTSLHNGEKLIRENSVYILK